MRYQDHFSFGDMGKVGCYWNRLYGGVNAAWVVSLGVDIRHGHAGGGELCAAMLQAPAVVDDFGVLVLVGRWA